MEYLISKGSKNAIAKEIVDFLPKAETFVDICAGGCAVSHAAMLSGKYNKIVINDVNPMPTQLFIDAMNGKYKNERRWISREDFNRLKDTDAYVKYCWSFGNNGKDYLYGADVEEFKHGLHLAIFESDTGLLEKVLNLPDGAIPHYDGVTDISKRYALYRKYLQSVVGGGDGQHTRLQTFERLESIGGATSAIARSLKRAELQSYESTARSTPRIELENMERTNAVRNIRAIGEYQ